MQTKITLAALAAALLANISLSGGRTHAQTTLSQTANVAQTTKAAQTAQTPSGVSPEALRALRTLESVPYFATGGVGGAGVTSPGEAALRVLLKQEKPEPLLRGLLKTASSAGKLYALLGLKQSGQTKAFEQVAAELGKNKTPVETMRGCLGSRETVAVVAARIKKGDTLWRPETAKQPAK